MEKTFINQLSKGQAVESHFLVKEKVLAKTKAGIPYLSIRLADRTGEAEGRIWDNALDFISLFERDDFVKVKAEVDEFQGMLQLRIFKLRKSAESEVQLEDYLPKTSKDIESMFRELKTIASGVRQPFLQKLLEDFFQDEQWTKKFKMVPAAKAVHHVFLGGLLEHTLSVVQLALLIGPRYPGIDQDLLLTGAVFHDMGKISELSWERAFDYTDPGRLLGHIILTVEMIDEKMRAIPDFPDDLALLLKHLILSHHGEYEFGSPKLPMTLEAVLLHHIDDMDAKVNAIMAWIEKEKSNPSRWTSYNKLLERFIFKPEE
ncbi:MAG TPA: HD domain-containing protein [Thermodesulfobacteriota bacterium]|nr:HD domain-containing protein [Thermodesulfobacteriota bacterium]